MRAPGPNMVRGALVISLGACVILLGQFDYSLCPLANLTGHPCPGCGMTRAAVALLTLDWRSAVRFHPLAPIVVPLALALLGPAVFRFVRGAEAERPRTSAPSRFAAPAFVLVAVALIAVWVARFFGAFGGPVEVQPLWRAPALSSALPNKEPQLTRTGSEPTIAARRRGAARAGRGLPRGVGGSIS
jgi:hypothetical protein